MKHKGIKISLSSRRMRETVNQMTFFLGFERRISLEHEVGDEKRQCRTPDRHDNTPKGIGLEYEVDEEKQWENVNSNAKPRKPNFIQKTARTYSPFMNKDVSKRGVSGSNEAVCKTQSFGNYFRRELL